MKILIVNTFYYPNMVGGTEQSIKLLAEGLVAKGHEVSVYTCDSNGDRFEEVISGVKVFRDRLPYLEPGIGLIQKNFRKITGKFCKYRNTFITEYLDYIAETFKPDIVHVNNVNRISDYVWEFFNRRNIKIVETVRDYYFIDPKVTFGTLGSIIKRPHKSYFKKMSNNYVDGMTVASSWMLKKFENEGFFENSLKVIIPNAVKLNSEQTDELIIHKQLRKNSVRFLFVGSLEEHKGIQNLISAFSSIKNTDIKLTICGSGNREKMVAESAKNDPRIQFKGQLEGEQLENEYIVADVLVVPSVWNEPFGRVVIEGYRYGLVSIGAGRAGIKEITDMVQGGILFNPDSVESLEAALVLFSKRDNFRQYYSGIRENISKYSLAENVSSYIEFYNRVLSRSVSSINKIEL